METTQMSTLGKVMAGILLISCSLLAMFTLIAFWPDRLPDVNGKANRYVYELFNMTLYDSTLQQPPKQAPVKDNNEKKVTVKADSLKNKPSPPDVSASKPEEAVVQGLPLMNNQTKPPATHKVTTVPLASTIHLNILLLILVASAGFLGAMVHIAASFTNFVGAGEFKRSWVLWYFVKPFTGAAVAVIFYFVFRAGFFSGTDNGGSINIYGIISLAALAGLFTDKATLKLEEVFVVIFKPKDDRPNKMQDFQITEVMPAALKKTVANLVTIKGKALTKRKVTIKMDDDPIVNPAVMDEAITFTYTVPATRAEQQVIKMTVMDDQGKEFKKEFVLQ
ncbi:hypothetical protein SAMN04488505_10628 [Chitinophaga rupis]|uniref:IPT/TIG domain-containing protein n=1 Tax=Chitinophaga rupis TaxID=573321 RepID=A0A1H8AUX3_9BACT|nr:hypothetical protein [Chitinophaga rupis]SEM74520.1 hypothetical protein SAMN04488505_10628 [Chitinophaga rupis]